MKTVCDRDSCCGCGACLDVCPKDSIHLVKDYFTINAVIEDNCINCKACKRVCPSINQVSKYKPIEWHQGWAKNDIRENASSGGIASTIMQNFINNGGSVAACIFDSGKFLFKITDDIEQIKYFAGSKYVKSEPKGIYKQIEQTLKIKPVLFIGLPCQVAAVKLHFKNIDNLYTIDLICHGTPNIQVLSKFLKEKKYELNTIKDITFRKKKSEKNSYIKIEKCVDDYMLAFLYSICYTDNCYECKYAEIERVSDITLGDSWGTELTDELKNGISLILVQNLKGQELLKDCEITLKPVNMDIAIKHNQQLERPVQVTKARRLFVENINKGRSFSYSTIRAIPEAVFIQKVKKFINKESKKNPFGLSILK